MVAFTIPYKKYFPPAPPHQELLNGDLASTPPLIEAAPNWLNITYSPNAQAPWFTFSFSAKPSVADTLPVGLQAGEVRIRIYFGTTNIFSLVSTFTVTIDVQDTVLLTLSPTNMVFNYNIGAPTPALQNLNILSENNWVITKDQSWITLSATSGINGGDISIGVNTNGLAVGNYSGTVTVNDGMFIRTVAVSLIVTNTETPTEFLNINPQSLEFVETVNIASTQTKNIIINATEAWNATKNQAWLLIDISSGNIGIETMVASVDITGLSAGINYATIEIVTATFIKTINVVLIITEVATQGIQSGQLYFAKDRNKLLISNTTPNTFALLDFNAITILETLIYPKKAPFFKGLAIVPIGDETVNILQADSVTDNFTNRIISPVIPVQYDFKVYDKDLVTNNTTLRQSFSNVTFLNGKTPKVANRLTYLPSVITTTKDAIIAISFLDTTTPSNIEVTGDITQTIGASAITNTLYTAIIDLSTLVLQSGDSITLTVGNQAVVITIKPNEAQHTLLAFENEWQLPEYFMLTGALKITSKKGWKTTKVNNNGDDHEKILEAEHPIVFSVNSGWIYSQEEIDWLDQMFQCKKFHLFIKGIKTEVVPTFSRLVPFETRKHTVSFNLTFRKAIV